MLPLIDVLFLLLAVFVLSVANMVRSYAVPVDLPKAATGEQDQLPSVLLLSVEADGQFSLGGERTELEVIRAQVAERVAGDPSLRVMVQADKNCRWERVVELLDTVRAVGGGRVLLVADPLESGT